MSSRELSAEMLLAAYASGVFPMAETRDDPEVFWVDPRQRGVLPLDGFHVSRSLARRMRAGTFRVTMNRDLAAVMEGCADREETWINDTIFALMMELHARGFAHSFEVWQGERLVGGTYGVALGAAFFGESMFSRATDASKTALAFAVDHLRRTGFRLFDTQFTTPHLLTLGAVEIERAEYRDRLAAALDAAADIYGVALEEDAAEVIRRLRGAGAQVD